MKRKQKKKKKASTSRLPEQSLPTGAPQPLIPNSPSPAPTHPQCLIRTPIRSPSTAPSHPSCTSRTHPTKHQRPRTPTSEAHAKTPISPSNNDVKLPRPATLLITPTALAPSTHPIMPFQLLRSKHPMADAEVGKRQPRASKRFWGSRRLRRRAAMERRGGACCFGSVGVCGGNSVRVRVAQLACLEKIVHVWRRADEEMEWRLEGRVGKLGGAVADIRWGRYPMGVGPA